MESNTKLKKNKKLLDGKASNENPSEKPTLRVVSLLMKHWHLQTKQPLPK